MIKALLTRESGGEALALRDDIAWIVDVGYSCQNVRLGDYQMHGRFGAISKKARYEFIS